MIGRLAEHILAMPIVDAHEHLRPETARLQKRPDVMWLFHQYAGADLLSAGMSKADHDTVMDWTAPLEDRWPLFEPWFDRIRHTGYARAVGIALRDIYGIDRLDQTTYQEASERIRAGNQPGFIDRCLIKRGNIECILNCDYEVHQPIRGSRSVMPIWKMHDLVALQKASGIRVVDLESYRTAIGLLLTSYHAQGVVALKMIAKPWTIVDESQGAALLAEQIGGACSNPERLQMFLLGEVLALAQPFCFTITVHTGYYSGVFADFTESRGLNMIPLLGHFRELHFDLLHLSHPWFAEAIAIGKGFPNVSLNLAWCAILNPLGTERVMAEIIGQVPHNKILAFGGDYWELPDVAYGHLRMVQRALTRALTSLVEDGVLGLADAVHIAELWLRENAYALYPLVRSPQPRPVGAG